MNHSIIDSSALIIDTPAGKIIHTGDFKIDATPFIGAQIDMSIFEKAGDEGVLLLLSDSTNVEKHTHNISESEVYQAFEHLLAAAEGLCLVSMFSSNVSRVGQVMKLAKKLGKKVVLSGRSMEQNVQIAADQGYLSEYKDCLISIDDMDRFARKKIIVVSTGSQAESRSALIRISNNEHSKIKITKGDTVIMSSRFIPGNERPIGRMINQLFMQGAEVLYESVHAVHTSGHATRPELQLMLKKVRPKYFVPIHGEYRHLVRHVMMAKEMGYTDETALVARNCDVIELTPDSCSIVEHLEDNRVLVENREGSAISKTLLKERRHLGEKGVVFVLMARDRETQEILSSPQVIAQGLVHESMQGFMTDEAQAVAAKVVQTYMAKIRKGDYSMDLEEEVRVNLRRFFNSNLGKKPTVLPSIVDV